MLAPRLLYWLIFGGQSRSWNDLRKSQVIQSAKSKTFEQKVEQKADLFSPAAQKKSRFSPDWQDWIKSSQKVKSFKWLNDYIIIMRRLKNTNFQLSRTSKNIEIHRMVMTNDQIQVPNIMIPSGVVSNSTWIFSKMRR